MRILSCACAAVLLLGATAVAQRHTQGWVYTNNGLLGPAVAHMDLAGTVTELVPNGLLAQASSIVMDRDNRHYLLARTGGGLLRLDPTGSIVATLLPTTNSVRDICVDMNGHYIAAVAPTLNAAACLLRINAQGAITTVFQGAPLTSPVSVCTDIRTGDFIVLDGALVGNVIRIRYDGTLATPIASLGLSVGNKIRQDKLRGHFWVSSHVNASQAVSLVQVTAQGVVSSILGLELGGLGTVGLACDRVSDTKQAVTAVTQGALSCSIYTVETATATVTKVKDLAFEAAQSIEQAACRELQSHRAGPGVWNIDMRVLTCAGREFVIGASLTGHTGVRLPDGRTLPLLPDPLTLECVGGGLLPVIRGTRGWLDLTGHARATVDISMFPFLIGSGIRVWFTGVALDANAALGIDVICDPIVIRL